MRDIKAKIVNVEDKYRIEAEVNGEKNFLGKYIDNVLFKWVEFETEQKAYNYIVKSDRLYKEAK